MQRTKSTLGFSAEPIDDNIFRWRLLLSDFEPDRYGPSLGAPVPAPPPPMLEKGGYLFPQPAQPSLAHWRTVATASGQLTRCRTRMHPPHLRSDICRDLQRVQELFGYNYIECQVGPPARGGSSKVLSGLTRGTPFCADTMHIMSTCYHE